MGGDSFTQIRNAVFRDPRLSAKAMGIFGNISTHRDGWGVTPEMISTQMRDGVSAIKAGLRELEAYGYLQRTQSRRADGTMGASEYYITDLPEAVEAAVSGQNPRSEPADDYPPTVEPQDAGEDPQQQNPRSEPADDYPPAVNPPAVNRTHKKTTSKNISRKKTLSPPPSPERPAEPAPVAERETAAAPSTTTTTTAQRVVREASVVALVDEEPFIDWAAGRYKVAGGGWWRRVADNGDLVDIVAAWQAERASDGRSGGSLPPWCGECGDGMPAEFNPRFRVTPDGGLCDCHPDRHPGS